jgi:LacI family transcriptional regulator
MKMLAGISDICQARGVELLVHYARQDQLQTLTSNTRPALLQPDHARGLILLNHFPPETVAWLTGRWPCVEINHHITGLDTDIIDVDAGDGIGRLVERLVALGHRTLGFVGDARQYTWAHARHAAFFQALNMHGLEYAPSRFARTTAKEAAALAGWLDEKTRDGVTAWMCANDGLAKSIGTELLKLGYSIPDDVSLTGFDGTATLPDGRHIASISTPYEALGAAAAHRLLRRLEHPHAARPHILIPGRVVNGETVGIPRTAKQHVLPKETCEPKPSTEPVSSSFSSNQEAITC